MTKKILGLIVPVLLLASLATAQKPTTPPQRTDANISGHVIDTETGKHMPHVSITIKGTTISILTDATGHYYLKNLPLGSFTIVASFMGYGNSEIPISLVKGKTIEVDFDLSPTVMNMDEIVVSSNRTEVKRKESSSIVNVMSSKDFETTSSNNMAEALNYQPGLRVEYNCSNCSVPQLRINGLQGQYSQMLLDSRPIFSSLASVYGLEQLPASMVERVEVIRGGGSALFGSNAIGGVVNIITREPISNTVWLSNQTASMDGSMDINTSLGGSLVSDDYRAGVYIFGMIRSREEYDRNGDGFSELPKLNTETIGFRGYYKTSPFTKLTAEYHHIREFRRGGNDFSSPPDQTDITEQLRHGINGGGLKFDIFSKNMRHKANIYAGAQHIDRDSYFGTDHNPDAYGHTNDMTIVGGAQYTYSFRKLFFMPADLTAGVEYNGNSLDDEMLGYGRQINQDVNTIGGYLQNEWRNEKMSILLGGRLDKNSMIDNMVFCPRATVRYTPSGHAILRASYSSGYRAPQAYDEDLHVAAVGGNVAIITLDPDLKPEYSHSVSASADLYEKFGPVQANLLIEGFYTNLKDVFTLVENGYDGEGNLLLERVNASGAEVYGINAELNLSIGKRLQINTGYTYQWSLYKEAQSWSNNPDIAPQRRMLRTPNSYGYGTVNYNPFKTFNLSGTCNYTGNMIVPHYSETSDLDYQTSTQTFWVFSLKLSYDFKLSASAVLQLNCGVKNITDAYQPDVDTGAKKDAGYIYGPAEPRTFYGGVKFSF